MNNLQIDSFAKRMSNNPIAKSPKLTAGDYAIQKTNDDYSVIVEVNGKWQPVKETEINKVPTDVRWIMFNTVYNHKSQKPVTASVNHEFRAVALKANLLMTVSDKGYTTIDNKPLSAKELKALKSETIEEPAIVE